MMDRYELNLTFNEEPLRDVIPIWRLKVDLLRRTENERLAILNSIAKNLRLFPRNVEGLPERKMLIAERHQDKIAILPEPLIESDLKKGLKVKAWKEWFTLHWDGEDKLDFKKPEHLETIKLLILRATEIALIKKKYFISERTEHEGFRYIIASRYVSGLSTAIYETYSGIAVHSHIFPLEDQCEIALRVDVKYNLIPRATISDELHSKRSSLKNYAQIKGPIWTFDEDFSVYDICPLSPERCLARLDPDIPCRLRHPINSSSECRMYQINFNEKVRGNQKILDSLSECDQIKNLSREDPVVIVKFPRDEKTLWSYTPIRLRRIFHTEQVTELGQLTGFDTRKIEREKSHTSKLLHLGPYDRYHQVDLQALKNVGFGGKILAFSPTFKELEAST